MNHSNQTQPSDQVPNSFTTLNLLHQSQSNHTRPQPIPRSQSNLNLDQTSKSHLYSIILQSIENAGLISNLNHHQKRKINHHFNSTSLHSNQHFFWANELFRIIDNDLLDCFTDQILTELQLTKLNLSKSLQELNQRHISSNLRKNKSNPNSPHPLSHTRSGLFTSRVKDHKDSYPNLQTAEFSRSKSPDALLATQTKQDRPNLSPSLFVTALQTASPPELWLPEHSLSTNSLKPELVSRTTLIETLKARTSELIIESHPDHSTSDSCTSPKLDQSIGDSDIVDITVRAVKFHLKRIKTKPLDNQREASFEPNQWSNIPAPAQDNITQVPNPPEASTSKAIRPRIMGQTDIVELFSDSSCKMSDLLGGDSNDPIEPLLVTLRDGRVARVRTELIGGTITLKGPGRELRKLKKVIELAIFAACNMKLEVHVRRDAFCSRPVFLSSQQFEEPRPMALGAEEGLSTPPPHLDDLIPSSIAQDTPHIAFAQDTPPQSKTTFSTPHSPSNLFGPPDKPFLPHSISSQYSIITADSNWLSPPPPAVASSTSLPLSSPETPLPDASPSTLVSPGPSLDYATPPQSPQSFRDPLHSTSPTFQRSPLNSSSASIAGRAKWSKAGLWSMLLGKPAQSHAHPPLFVPSASSPLDQPHYNHHGSMTETSEIDGIISGDEADTDEDPKSVTPDRTKSPTPKKSIGSSWTPSSSRSPESSPVKESSPTARKRFAQRIKKRLENPLETSPTKYHRTHKPTSIMPGSFLYNTYGRGSRFGRRGYAESDEWELVAGFEDSPSGRARRDSAEDGDTTDAGGHGGDESCSIDSLDNQVETLTENQVPSPDATSESSDKPKSRTFVNRLSDTLLHFKPARIASQKIHRPPTKIAQITDETSQPTPIETQLAATQILTETEDEVQGDESEKEHELGSVINQPIVGRFERVIEKMNRAILSVSPDVIFPPPHLLVRLRQQEIAEISLFTSNTDILPQQSDLGNSYAVRSPQITSPSDEISPSTITSPKLSELNPTRPTPLDRQRSFATADAECLSNRFAEINSLPNSAESTPVRVQKTAQPLPQSPRSVLSASDLPTSQSTQDAPVVEPRETVPDALHPNPLLTQSPRPRKPLEQRKIAVDARAGLASLMTNNSSLDGTLRHQSIQFLCEKSSLFSSPGTTACESPTWKTWKYYQDFCLNPRALDLLERKGKRERIATLPTKETGFNVGSLMGLGVAAELLGNQTSNEPVLDTRGLQYKLTGTVGQVVSKLVDERDQLCVQESGIAGKCGGKRMGDHVISLIHNTVRIIVSVEDQLAVAKVSPSSLHDEELASDHKGLKRSTSDGGMIDVPLSNSKEDLSDHEIVMWTKCRICGRCTKPVVCSEATLLYSFAKYLELILYDGNFVPAPEDLCDHGTERQDALIRFFSKDKARVKLALETVDLFELRLPTAIDQSIRDDGMETGRPTFDPHQNDSIRQLEDEITGFFGSLFNRTSMIDDILFRRDQRLELVQQRANPANLSEDSEINRATPNVNKESTPSVITEEEKIEKALACGGISRGRSHTIKAAVTDHRGQLQNLIKAFEKEESDLKSHLPDLDPSNLNSLRKPFFDTIVRIKARLMTWEKKHLSTLTGPDGRQKLGEANFLEPIYAQPGIHALPADTSIIIREAEISSIIAFTLSSSDYKTLLSTISNPKRASTPGSSSNHSRSSSNVFGTPIPSPPGMNNNGPKRDFSLPIALLSSTEELPDVPLGGKASPLGSPRMKSTQNNGTNNQKSHTNDPDDDQATFGKDCSFEGRAKLKKPYKQNTGILSLRSLSKQKSFDVGSFRAFGGGGSRINTPAAKNMNQDPMTMFDENPSLLMMNEGGDDKILDDLITSSQPSTISSTATAKPKSVTPGPVAALLSRGAKAEASTVSISHTNTLGDIDVMIKSRASSIKSKASIDDLEKVIEQQEPSINDALSETEDEVETLLFDHSNSDAQQTPPASRMLSKAQALQPSQPSQPSQPPPPPSSSQSLQSSQPRPAHASILSAPLQAIWTLGGSIKMKQGGTAANGAGIDPKDFDGTDPDSNPNSSPHIKYKFKHGTKEFSCTIWHASQFKEIRQRCGVSEEFLIESLSRCNTWNTTGGKSSSNFFITNDQRFILKGMITNWNKSEREGLLSFAPNYFNYISNQTLIKPSLICKIFGFFTIKIKERLIGNSKNESNLIKLDLLLMENLFYGQTITRKFDLKGITSRVAKVKKDEKDGGTGWDADWIEGSLRTLLLIHPHSKHVISNAIENDTKFLSESNVMDYSLLVGVDDLRKELVVGMIDVIGTFNLAKMLESRGKMVLKSSDKKGEVTILPPIEYANRFKKAMETYFVAVPEKWSRPLEKNERNGGKENQEDPSLSSVF